MQYFRIFVTSSPKATKNKNEKWYERKTGPCITLCFVLGKSVVIQNRVEEIMNLAKRGFLHLCCTVLKPREICVMQEIGV